mmetsp:Transcript_27940/g.26796  ORF Transcript_27940/g.26796 Transcript_27940/m.26796 type:complete len:464 (+) Transcript_27940:331-1722(+)
MMKENEIGKFSKVFIADMQILGSAFFFGIGFLGQRAVMVNGLGPMTCNAFRFGLSTILLVACLPIIPVDQPETEVDSDDECNESYDTNDNLIQDIDNDDDNEDDIECLIHLEDETKFTVTDGKIPKNYREDKDKDKEKNKDTNKSKIINVMNKLLGRFLGSRIRNIQKTVWFWGILLGCINFGASGFQQWGISLTSASKCAFIAGFDLFLIPVFGLFVQTNKHNATPERSTWFAVGIAIVGLFFLSGSRLDDLELGMGETLTIVSTVFWTLHITYTDMATAYVDSISMMCIQLGVVTLLSCLAALTFEPQQWLWDHILVFLPWLIFLAISEGLGFTLMAVGQNYSPPTHAAIILSLEGVFASIASYIFLNETLNHRELSGCFLMLLAALIAKMGIKCIDSKIDTQNTHDNPGHRIHSGNENPKFFTEIEVGKLMGNPSSQNKEASNECINNFLPDFHTEKLKI